LKKKYDVYNFLKFYSLGEEIANAVTHGIGAVFSVAGLILLVVLAYQRGAVAWQIASLSVYGASLVLLHLSSTLYHSLRPPKAKLVFRVFDHGSIYLLIAGTYTPFLVVGMPGTLAWFLLGTIWALAITGIVDEVEIERGSRRQQPTAVWHHLPLVLSQVEGEDD